MTLTQDDVATAVSALLEAKKVQLSDATDLNTYSRDAAAEYEKRLFDLQAEHLKKVQELHSSYMKTLSNISVRHKQILTTLCKLDDQLALLLDKHLVNTHA